MKSIEICVYKKFIFLKNIAKIHVYRPKLLCKSPQSATTMVSSCRKCNALSFDMLHKVYKGFVYSLSLKYVNNAFSWRPFWKMAAIFFQQNIPRVGHIENVQKCPLNKLIPMNPLQQPMSLGPCLPPGYQVRCIYTITSVQIEWSREHGDAFQDNYGGKCTLHDSYM